MANVVARGKEELIAFANLEELTEIKLLLILAIKCTVVAVVRSDTGVKKLNLDEETLAVVSVAWSSKVLSTSTYFWLINA